MPSNLPRWFLFLTPKMKVCRRRTKPRTTRSLQNSSARVNFKWPRLSIMMVSAIFYVCWDPNTRIVYHTLFVCLAFTAKRCQTLRHPGQGQICAIKATTCYLMGLQTHCIANTLRSCVITGTGVCSDVYENFILLHKPNGEWRVVSCQEVWRHISSGRDNVGTLEGGEQLLCMRMSRVCVAIPPKSQGSE
jgi:hypothetical protein